MAFLRNSWYVAGWSSDLMNNLIGRRILDEPVVLYRLPTGEAVATSGRCPHRFAPLHLGKIIEGELECPYHGLRFNSKGGCVFNPQGPIPKAAQLRSYPVVERYGALWIWMGDATIANPEQLPDYPFLESDRFAVIKGYVNVQANYELLSDNIMDLGHVDFLHASSFGTGATVRAKTAVRRVGNAIHCDRWMANHHQGPLTSRLFGREGQAVDAWVDVRWNPPSLMLLTFGMTDVGAPRSQGSEIPATHFMTPETEYSTHYFWSSARSFRVDDQALTEQFRKGAEAAFTLEDKPMIEAQQQMMGGAHLFSLNPVFLSGDNGPVQARRVLAELVDKEASRLAEKTVSTRHNDL
jgi:phenylpropionate dioxygenase-like ring-hydroxylating dioxygenase large terminal subunit